VRKARTGLVESGDPPGIDEPQAPQVKEQPAAGSVDQRVELFLKLTNGHEVELALGNDDMKVGIARIDRTFDLKSG
jgi:hypothetical protein